MGHKNKEKCKKSLFKKIDNLGFIVAALGIGMILVVVLPMWVWVLIVGIALIVEAFNIFCKKHK